MTTMAPELHEASSIREFFAGRHVLITGATGFIGSVLLEKLLRSCQQIDTLYLLLRPRRGKNVEERVQDLLKSPLFRNIDAKQKTKVKAVEGDMSLANLGFNPDERISLCRRVSVVFHAAATINFNAALQSAINTNLRGTQCVLELCHQMPQLQALVYVSSAYCNSKLGRVLLEQVYPSQYHPQEVLDLVKKLSPEQILAATPEITRDHPNTYAFSKHLAEVLIQKERKDIPVAIIRPTVVLATMTEPFPGWIDNVHTGGFAFIAGTAKGAFRVSCADHRCLADLVPCDQVANLLIAAAWRAASHRNTPSLEVYHLSSASSNPITWGEYTDAVVKLVREFPCSEVLWYPASKCRLSPLRMYSSVFLLQVFPACVLNLLAKIQGTSDQGLLSIQLKFWRGMMHVKYFTKRQWIFDGSNTAHLAAMLSPKDKLDFNFNVKRINWTSFLTTNILGLREHFHKEPLDTLVSARHKMKTYFLVHVSAHVFLLTAAFFAICFAGFDPVIAALAAIMFTAFVIWL